MQKGKRRFVSSIAISEISLLILSIIAIGFIFGESTTVSAQLGILPSGTTSAGGFNVIQDAQEAAAAEKAAAEGGGGFSDIYGFVGDIYGGKTFANPAVKDPVTGAITTPASTSFIGGLISAVAWAGTAYLIVRLAAPLFGADEKLTTALSNAALAGVFAGRAAYFIIQSQVSNPIIGAAPGGLLIGVGVALVVFALTYKKDSKKIVNLQCLPWEAPLGGADCEKCNQDPLRPCSEYRCKSLGQACELLNKGSVEERCAWVSRGDVNSPIITPWTEILTTGYTYTDITGRPPSRGTKIVGNANGCVKPFTPLEFGLKTNEPSQCKIDYVGNKSFDEMQFYFGESNLYAYNHTQILRLPSPGSINVEGPEIPNEGIYNMYTRCRDANGNANDDEFVFNFCVDPSPDTTPPAIESTSILDGSPVQFGAQNTSLSVLVNEPAECKWSIQDKNYDDMENTMICSTKVYEQNAQQLYPCSTTLQGIKDHEENHFFFRCKDQPSKAENERNVNTQSFPLTLKGTQLLNILSVGPNETFTGNTDLVPVELTVRTDDGAEEGKSICYFSSNGQQDDYVAMFTTNSFEHKQTLVLPSGDYTYYFRCVDAGGNAAEETTEFTVALDRNAPQITRVYKEGPDALKVITNEDAVCTYSLSSCNYALDEGLPLKLLSVSDQTVYAVEWKPNQAYYIKCKDLYGNEPSPNACSIIASATTVH